MSKHTPGPWDWQLLASHRREIVSGEDESAAVVCRDVRTTEDARLIAAAPALLTGLQDIRRIIHGRGLSVEKLGRCNAIAEALILKATGE